MSSIITEPNLSATRTSESTQQSPTRRTILMGCPVDLIASATLLKELTQAIDTQSGPKVIQFVNGNKIAQVRHDRDMGRIMGKADYALVDGQPLLPMGRLLGVHIPERIDGVGLMAKLLKLADERRYSVFLLGAKQDVLDSCVQKIKSTYPNLRIAGSRNGYFSEKDTDGMVAQIRASRADILFLGMGSPMKERFADRYASQLGTTVIQGVGGSFDVMAGLVKRAPVWIQRIGMEWAFRVSQEPRRMFWRYTTTNATCLWAFFRALPGALVRRF
jgi:N-acetylglucosaminyldiphosphoundecaprenol N-acetyl-beta-D-mannosaminyltransferase